MQLSRLASLLEASNWHNQDQPGNKCQGFAPLLKCCGSSKTSAASNSSNLRVTARSGVDHGAKQAMNKWWQPELFNFRRQIRINCNFRSPFSKKSIVTQYPLGSLDWYSNTSDGFLASGLDGSDIGSLAPHFANIESPSLVRKCSESLTQHLWLVLGYSNHSPL